MFFLLLSHLISYVLAWNTGIIIPSLNSHAK